MLANLATLGEKGCYYSIWCPVTFTTFWANSADEKLTYIISETWPLTKPNLQRLQRNDRAMIRQIFNVRPQDIVTTRSNELLVRLGIEDLDLILKERRLRWYGHVERSSGAIKTAFDIQVDGKQNDMEAADREGLQRVEALGHQPL